MKEKIILFFLFISFNAHSAQQAYNSNHQIESMCNSTHFDKYLGAQNAISLNITVEKSRKWGKNYIQAVTDTSSNIHIPHIILEKYKKNFNADIEVSFNNGLICHFPAKIRISGDGKDHLNAPPPITSLDVKLLRGNINSSTKFKLFLPPTRGNDNEIFVSALLNNLKFVVPKTYYVPTTFNGQEVTFLFQEKITKELLESNQLREGPILEGDERFLWRKDSGTDKTYDRFNLARLVNREWADKGLSGLRISKDAVSILNKAYLEYLLGMHYYNSHNEWFLNSVVLGNNNELATKKNQEFQALMAALTAHHGLRPHNRLFYYDPMYKYFLPIYYDGNSEILLDQVTTLPNLNKDVIIGSNYAITSIENLDKNKFINQLKNLGVNISQKKLDKILNTIKLSLQKMSKAPDNNMADIYRPYFSKYSEPGKLLAFSNGKIPQIISCDFSLTDCDLETLSQKNYSKLLNGRYKNLNGNEYLFVGNNKLSYESGIDNNHSNEPMPKIIEIESGVRIVIYGQMDISLDRKNKVLSLDQNNLNDRALIVGGSLIDWKINFQGNNQGINDNQQNFDANLLTGCLTFLDMQVDNVSIVVNNVRCEDGINFIRVDGFLNNINIQYAMRDALDVDFSNLHFNNIDIDDAGNDCIDFSSGEYKVTHSTLNKCRDKAISIGEKTVSFFKNVNISNSNIGIASKDSSIATINNANFKNTTLCLSAYNKKQEFWGGKIIVDGINCPLDKIFQEKNSIIKVSM